MFATKAQRHEENSGHAMSKKIKKNLVSSCLPAEAPRAGRSLWLEWKLETKEVPFHLALREFQRGSGEPDQVHDVNQGVHHF